ncbi:MAG: hypothetical protein IT370_00505 [Deltaproteobacteria bacterium]|nr:hypothetical protein [Deltaproteobacteria bacterium]
MATQLKEGRPATFFGSPGRAAVIYREAQYCMQVARPPGPPEEMKTLQLDAQQVAEGEAEAAREAAGRMAKALMARKY